MSLIEALEEIGAYLPQKAVVRIAGDLLEADEFDDDDDKRICALLVHLGDTAVSEVCACKFDCYGMSVYEAGGGEYAVATEDEANAAWDSALDNYIDECIRPEINGSLAYYFDEDAWKSDARHDGRGYCLSCYDGNEYEVSDLLIYRVN